MSLLAAFFLATLNGTILDAQNHPLAATVHLIASNASYKAQSDAAGHYQFPELAPGTYTLRIANCAEKIVTITDASQTLNLSCSATTAFFDEPQFTVAGVADNTYRGGHGSDAVLRSAESLTKSTAALRASSASDSIEAKNHHDTAIRDENAGKPLEAVREYQRAAELDPTESNLFDWGTELLVHRAAAAAAQVFTQGRQLHPESIRMLLALGASCYAEGDYDQAAQFLYAASDRAPNDRTPYEFLAKVKAPQMTQSDEFLARVARFARIAPDDPKAVSLYAQTLWNRNRDPNDPKIESLLKAALRQDPAFAPAYLQLGILYVARKDLSAAITNYGRAIQLDPALEEAHYRLAEAYAADGQAEEARRQRAIYTDLSRSSAARRESERNQLQQFVVTLKTPPQ